MWSLIQKTWQLQLKYYFFYVLFQNTCENSDIALVCHTDCEPRFFDFRLKKLNSCFCFIHQDNHFIQKYLTEQCCLLIMFSVHFKFFSRIIVSCKHCKH